MQRLGGFGDMVGGGLWILVVLHFVHLTSQQRPNPCFNVPFGNQHNNGFTVIAPWHIRRFECIRKLCGTVLRCFYVGINNGYQER